MNENGCKARSDWVAHRAQIDRACELENVKGDWPKELIMSYVQWRSDWVINIGRDGKC